MDNYIHEYNADTISLIFAIGLCPRQCLLGSFLKMVAQADTDSAISGYYLLRPYTTHSAPLTRLYLLLQSGSALFPNRKRQSSILSSGCIIYIYLSSYSITRDVPCSRTKATSSICSLDAPPLLPLLPCYSPCSLTTSPCSLSAPSKAVLLPRYSLQRRPCSLSRSKRAISKPKFRVYIIHIYTRLLQRHSALGLKRLTD